MHIADKHAAWKDIHCVSMPVEGLEILADFRDHPDIWVALTDGRAWVRWRLDIDIAAELVAGRLLPVEGVELFTGRDGEWYRLGERVPAFGVPFRDGSAGGHLDRVVIPGRLSVLRPGKGMGDPVGIRLVRDDGQRLRPATAFLCPYSVLSTWADGATSAQLTSLQSAWRVALDNENGDAQVLVLGNPGKLPLLPESLRYWGTGLLMPLGFRAEPDLRESVIRGAAGAGDNDLALLDQDGLELIARDLFKPLTRAGVRLGGRAAGGAPLEGKSPT